MSNYGVLYFSARPKKEIVSINDPYKIQQHAKSGKHYVTQGRETFYDEENYLIMFETEEEAQAWIDAGEPRKVRTRQINTLQI